MLLCQEFQTKLSVLQNFNNQLKFLVAVLSSFVKRVPDNTQNNVSVSNQWLK
jgi:hypothetical protein